MLDGRLITELVSVFVSVLWTAPACRRQPSFRTGGETGSLGENEMTDTFVVGYDGSESSKRAVTFAAARAKPAGAHLHLVQVLEWSPYSFHTPEELAERHMRREQELDRATAILAPAIDELTKAGHTVTSEARHGHVGDLMCEIAKDKGAAQIIIGKTGGTGIASRLLGSLAITLVQASPVPVTVVP